MGTCIHIINIHAVLNVIDRKQMLADSVPYNTDWLSELDSILLLEDIVSEIVYAWLTSIEISLVDTPPSAHIKGAEYSVLYTELFKILNSVIGDSPAIRKTKSYELFIHGGCLNLILTD